MKNIFLFIVFLSLNTIAQTNTIDNTFNPNDNGDFQQNIGTNSVLLPDGKLLAVYNQSPNEKVIRLNSDGSIDRIFNYTDQSYIDEIFVKSDGNFLTSIISYNDISGNSTIKSYNADGTINTAFTIPVFENVNGNGTEDYIHLREIIYQNDGKIIVVGDFTKVNNVTCSNIVRLNSNGSIDTSFTHGIIFNATYGYTINTIAMQSDGKYVVAGEFPSVAANSNARIARINNDGTLDTSFNVYSTGSLDYTINGFSNYIDKVAVQTDGKIVVACDAFRDNGAIVSYGFTRLNSDGTRDTTFITAYNMNSGQSIDDFTFQNDGKILYPGNNKLSRLNANGSIDTSFITLNTSYTSSSSLFIQNDKIIVNGDYNEPDGRSRKGIYRLNINGDLDITFNPCSGTNVISSQLNGNSSGNHNIKVLADGSFLILGTYFL